MQFYQKLSTQYNKATPAQRSYLNIGLTLGLLILLILLVYPAINHILKLNKEISDGRGIEKKLQDKMAALEDAESNYEQVKDRLEVVDDALPTGSSIDDYLIKVEKYARSNNSTIAAAQFNDIPLSAPTNKSGLQVKQVDYSLTIEGKFVNLLKFLTDFEKLVRTTDIYQISINEEGSTVSASIKATVYYLGGSSIKTSKAQQPKQPSTPEVGGNQ